MAKRVKWKWLDSISREVKRLKKYRLIAFLVIAVPLIGGGVKLYREALQIREGAKKPVLSIRLASPVTNHDGRRWIRFQAHNGGDKTAESFEWHILVPKDAAVEWSTGVVGNDIDSYGGVTYSHRWLRHLVPLPANGGTFDLVNISVKPDTPPRKFTALWFITWQETTFPGQQRDGSPKYGRITVE
jgi:hypothetical protein